MNRARLSTICERGKVSNFGLVFSMREVWTWELERSEIKEQIDAVELRRPRSFGW